MLPVTLVLAVSLAPPAAAAPTAQELANDVRSASARILAGGSPGDVTAALGHLLDVLARTAQDPQVPEAVRGKLRAARKAAVPGRMLDEAAIKPLRDAYAPLNDGTPFVIPDGLSDMEALTAYGKRLGAAAVGALERNDRAQATRSLLELILFVVTPVDAPPER